MDLFDLKGKKLVDYYSQFVKVQQLQSTTTFSVIFLKPIFARYGIPVTLISDNGPQFTSVEMKQFAEIYGFHYITSSPYFIHGQMAKLSEQCVLLKTSSRMQKTLTWHY